MPEIAILASLLALVLFILFRPRRDRYVRRVASLRNGQPWWRDKESY
ncbi:MAG: hypothetical protein L0332_07485 [Chloroflexi bacterium]|nr:hypothetical protein [Chloroflexota bacterium]MCI0575493.1 hypothetical protein [Chloroflexota bacterium]MCI0726551.1 hypothetical protein [Chloroflexota bacterium]